MAEVTQDSVPQTLDENRDAREKGLLDIVVLEERVATIASVPGTPK